MVQKWKAAAFKVFIQPHEFAFMHPLHAAAAAGYHAEQCRYEIIKNDSWLLNKCISVVVLKEGYTGFVCRADMGPNLHSL